MKIFYIILLSVVLTSCSNEFSNIEEEYYSILDTVRNQKEEELENYFSHIESTLKGIETDGPLMQAFFDSKRLYNAVMTDTEIEGSFFTFKELENIIQDSYFERFMIFDNLFFIDLDGSVFYSLKKQAPLLQNLFSDKHKTSRLSQSLLGNPLTVAVDFDFFISEDPTSFFVYPVILKDEHIGWCAFQFLSNKLDSLFSLDKSLGRTGEVFLVNENSYMLTNSSFSPENSVLKLHLSDENISQKFKEQEGHKEVIDYRGYRAISSFEVNTFFNINWLLIAKIDLDEIYTTEYKRNSGKYYKLIKTDILNRKKQYLSKKPEVLYENEVQLDHFKRISGNGLLYTHGVATCSAVLVTLPGEFSYLTHISAYDALYGGNYTDLINNIFNRIKKYEIPDYKIRELQVYVVTPRIMFSKNVLNRLVEEGVFLSQIHLIKNDDATYANIYHDIEEGKTFIEWHLKDNSIGFEDVDSISSVGNIMQGVFKKMGD